MNDLRKAAQQALEAWERLGNRPILDIDDEFDALRAALAQPEPPLSTGGWDCSEDGKQIFHDDFEFDAKLKVSGDFATDEQRIEFAQMVTKTLNGVITQPEQEPGFWGRVAARQSDKIKQLETTIADLKQPEQEPVAVVAMDISGLHMCYGGEYIGQKPDTKIAMLFKDLPVGTRLFAAPPQRKPLTGDVIDDIWEIASAAPTEMVAHIFARAIEAAHGIGGEE